MYHLELTPKSYGYSKYVVNSELGCSWRRTYPKVVGSPSPDQYKRYWVPLNAPIHTSFWILNQIPIIIKSMKPDCMDMYMSIV
jgi:hypothetical protein